VQTLDPALSLEKGIFSDQVFGQGQIPTRNERATLEYDFEDNHLNKFLIYDYA
jgi:hypothetical protein